MSDRPAQPPIAVSTPKSKLYSSELGSASGGPQRKRHREREITDAYTLQRDAAVRGMLLYTVLGVTACLGAHSVFPWFRRQTLAFKGFLTSGCGIFGLVVGADTVLLNHETRQRSEEELVRARARKELGRRGVLATEKEIGRWKEDVLRDVRERQARAAREQESTDASGPVL